MSTTITGSLAVAVLLAGCGAEPLAGVADQGIDLARLPQVAPAVALVRATSSEVLMQSLRDLPPRSLIQPASFAQAIPSKTPPCLVAGEPSAHVQSASAQPVALPTSSDWRYRLGEVPTLYLAALVRNVCGTHAAYFDLFAPDGSFHARIAGTFATGSEARRVDGGTVVEVALPLEDAGATLPGTWSVNFSLGEDVLALGMGIFELYE
jgi:hypothetical protein